MLRLGRAFEEVILCTEYCGHVHFRAASLRPNASARVTHRTVAAAPPPLHSPTYGGPPALPQCYVYKTCRYVVLRAEYVFHVSFSRMETYAATDSRCLILTPPSSPRRSGQAFRANSRAAATLTEATGVAHWPELDDPKPDGGCGVRSWPGTWRDVCSEATRPASRFQCASAAYSRQCACPLSVGRLDLASNVAEGAVATRVLVAV